MAYTVNQSQIAAERILDGVSRQRLMTNQSNQSASIELDRITLAAGASLPIRNRPADLAWFQILQGDISLSALDNEYQLTESHVCFVPPDFSGEAKSNGGAVVLFARVPEASRFDPEILSSARNIKVVDWSREPVLSSEHDARKRIYLVTPKLFGTKAIKGEMIIYPPGTEAANHHHEGAEHFMFVLSGSGTAWANEKPFAVREGDLIWYADCERHYLRSDDGIEMRFVEFFVPGVYKTTWAPGAMVCTWSPTGRNIQGGEAARAIAHHRSDAGTPSDV
jgi:quercetin dioxygenase-like cupin family protein